jgi:peroxiredoxin Q/BCP
MIVLGISFDTPEENRRFAEAQKFPFPLLCDVDRKVGLAYHACESASDAYPRRITYVIGPDGKIEQAIATQDPAGQAEQILACSIPRKS